MKSFRSILLTIAAVLLPATAWAGDWPGGAAQHIALYPDHLPQLSIGLGASTLGAGVVIGLHDPGALLGARVRANLFHFNINFTEDGAKSQAQAHLQNESIILDIYPAHGHFRISAGVVFNQNNAAFSSTPQLTGTLLSFIQRIHYNGAVGDVHGPITFNPVAPYLGVGYAWDIDKRWSISADFGAMYQGNGRIHLTPSGLIASNPQMEAGLTANAIKANKMISKMSFYPILDIQAAFRF